MGRRAELGPSCFTRPPLGTIRGAGQGTSPCRLSSAVHGGSSCLWPPQASESMCWAHGSPRPLATSAVLSGAGAASVLAAKVGLGLAASLPWTLRPHVPSPCAHAHTCDLPAHTPPLPQTPAPSFLLPWGPALPAGPPPDHLPPFPVPSLSPEHTVLSPDDLAVRTRGKPPHCVPDVSLGDKGQHRSLGPCHGGLTPSH